VTAVVGAPIRRVSRPAGHGTPSRFRASGTHIGHVMGFTTKLKRLLGLVEGHEEELAATVSKRTSVSKEQAERGLRKATDAVDTGSGERGN
jgi:hypothetical protein